MAPSQISEISNFPDNNEYLKDWRRSSVEAQHRLNSLRAQNKARRRPKGKYVVQPPLQLQNVMPGPIHNDSQHKGRGNQPLRIPKNKHRARKYEPKRLSGNDGIERSRSRHRNSKMNKSIKGHVKSVHPRRAHSRVGDGQYVEGMGSHHVPRESMPILSAGLDSSSSQIKEHNKPLKRKRRRQ